MKIDFWTSTEYSGFMAGLIRELRSRGFEVRQCYQIREASYREARSPVARFFLRFRQYVAYPMQLSAVLIIERLRSLGCRLLGHGKQRPSVQLETDEVGHRGGFACGRAALGKEGSLRGGGDLRTEELKGSSGCDVVVVSTNTFYAPVLATFFHPRVVHLVYDLFPEAMIHSGKWREGTLKVRLVRWLMKQTLRRAQLNVFLGERLKSYVESIHGPVPNAAIIEVGADQSWFPASPKQRLSGSGSASGTALGQAQDKLESSPTILYCGNFGNLHDAATLFAYWRRSTQRGFHAAPQRASHDGAWEAPGDAPQTLAEMPLGCYLFHCSGPKRLELEATVRELPVALRERIHLGGGLSQAEWVAVMESAEVALVTMAPGAETVVMPSKTYSAMMAGQAILAIAPEDSDLVDLIQAANCGWWVAPGDVDGLAAVLEVISNDRVLLLEKRERAYQHAHAHFGQDRLADQWEELFRKG